MGQLCTKSSNINFVEDFNTSFIYKNELLKFKEMEVYEHHADSSFKLIRGKNYKSYIQIKEDVEYLKNLVIHPNILTIHRMEPDPFSLNIYFDYLTSLEDYVDQSISINEVQNLMIQINSVLSMLQEQKIRYLGINPKGIFRVYTLKQYYTFKIGEQYIVKPVLMKYFQSPSLYYYNYVEHNLYKSDVFSLGLVILYCLGIKDTSIFYGQNQFNFPLLDSKLKELQLPTYLERLLRQMLEPDEQARPDPLQLKVSLLSYAKVYKIQTVPNEVLIYNHQQLQQMNELPEQQEDEIKISEPQIQKQETTNQILNEKMHGHLTYSSGYYYVGEYNGITRKREGKGIFFSAKGKILVEGTFLNDMPDGDDIIMQQEDPQEDTNHMNLSGWMKFKGQVVQGQKSGNGELWFMNQNRFVGQFIDDMAWGSGKYYYGDHIIEGNWVHNKFIA